jgi:hypothetical protein
MEVECWILVACPENSLIESKVCHSLQYVISSERPEHYLGLLQTDHHPVRALHRVATRTRMDGEVRIGL